MRGAPFVMRVSEKLAQVAVVLKDTTHAGNVGAAARAMRVMGLSRMVLVAAKASAAAPEARAMAAGADAVLEGAVRAADLAGGLAEFTHVYAFSARRRDMSPPCLSPREAAVAAMGKVAAGGRVAMLFGGERSGLENADVMRATAIVEIAAAPEYSSLNLAQAVQIAAYELRLAAGVTPAVPRREMPTREEFEAMMAHLEEVLALAGLPKAGDNRPLVPRLRRFLTRADPEASEVRLLRGVLKAAAIKLSK